MTKIDKRTREYKEMVRNALNNKVVKNNVVSPYTASIKILGKVFKAEGTSPEEAITNIHIEGRAKGFGVLTVSNGTQEKIKILNGFQTFRLFAPQPLTRDLVLKNIIPYFSNL
jgi:hypothetical protein